MRNILTTLCLSLLLCGAVMAADQSVTMEVNNGSSSDTLTQYEAVASCTTVVTVVTKVALTATATTKYTVADGLCTTLASSQANRIRWNLRIKTYEKNSNPTTDTGRYTKVWYTDAFGTKRLFTLRWLLEVDTTIVGYTVARVDSVYSTRIEADDSIAIYATSIGGLSVVSTTAALAHGTHTPYLGQVYSASILPRQRGTVTVSGITYGYVDAACKPGYFVYPSTSPAGALTPAAHLPTNGGWVAGQVLDYMKAASTTTKVKVLLYPFEYSPPDTLR